MTWYWAEGNFGNLDDIVRGGLGITTVHPAKIPQRESGGLGEPSRCIRDLFLAPGFREPYPTFTQTSQPLSSEKQP
jgi:hypothetical protein